MGCTSCLSTFIVVPLVLVRCQHPWAKVFRGRRPPGLTVPGAGQRMGGRVGARGAAVADPGPARARGGVAGASGRGDAHRGGVARRGPDARIDRRAVRRRRRARGRVREDGARRRVCRAASRRDCTTPRRRRGCRVRAPYRAPRSGRRMRVLPAAGSHHVRGLRLCRVAAAADGVARAAGRGSLAQRRAVGAHGAAADRLRDRHDDRARVRTQRRLGARLGLVLHRRRVARSRRRFVPCRGKAGPPSSP